MTKFLALSLCISIAWANAFAKPLQLEAIKVVPITESARNRPFELYVKLPKSYDPTSEKKYPVIYIADALWHIEIISGAIDYVIEDAILVGVSWEQGVPLQQSRMRDYMPNQYSGENYKHPTGEAKEHLTFLVEDVFKHIETHYKADPQQRSFFGYSVSGTFGSYILLTQPTLFKNYLIGSPVTLFDDYFVHEYAPIKEQIPKLINANVFISVGAEETPEALEHAQSLANLLKARTPKGQVEFKVFDSTDHSSAFPLTAIGGLYWLKNLTSSATTK